ncbi:hypothetical protein GCM10025870_02370 [Agromyces marinus]|uniref:Cytochrome oxidase subunit I profile domain-containing protein n=1 Tax=Agromyces marinus TaxID=1389020 RepID=A0ABM8GXH6_9MICO|nr:hypothetical protein GCM10025870_02370 [Agromyces marinus]
MTTTTAPARPAGSSQPFGAAKVERKGNVLVKWLTSTDHKVIGYLYLITSFIYFCIGGVMALIIRAQLFEPGLEIIQTREQYNQLFTMHGTIMLLMFATPLFAGFANVLMPLQIGAPDVAFPRLNAFAYWAFNFGSLMAVAGFFTPRVRLRSGGSPISHSPRPRSRRASAATSGCWASACPVSARSSVR